jgi:hypothetical protein
MQVQNFILVNEEKFNRALNGSTTSKGGIKGGIGNGAYQEEGVWKRSGVELTEKETEVLEHALLAEYDKLGGFIKLNGDKVKTGSFWDIKARKPKDTPEVMLSFRINGKVIDVSAEKELPPLVKAAQIMEAEKVTKKGKGKKKTNYEEM